LGVLVGLDWGGVVVVDVAEVVVGDVQQVVVGAMVRVCMACLLLCVRSGDVGQLEQGELRLVDAAGLGDDFGHRQVGAKRVPGCCLDGDVLIGQLWVKTCRAHEVGTRGQDAEPARQPCHAGRVCGVGAGAGYRDAIPHVGDGELMDGIPVVNVTAPVGCRRVVRVGNSSRARPALFGPQAHDVEQSHGAAAEPAAVTQLGHESGHHGANWSAFVVAGAPPPGRVGPHSALGDTLKDCFGVAVGGGAAGQLESQTVVSRMFGGQVGHTVPFGIAEVGVDGYDPIEHRGGPGLGDDKRPG
jgi:hypothetical protein